MSPAHPSEPHSHAEYRDHQHGETPGSTALSHVPGDPTAHRPDLEPGAGLGKWLLLDCFSGISGDMTLAALVDLGVPLAVVHDAVAALGLTGFELGWQRCRGFAIGATQFDVRVEGRQPPRHYADIEAELARAPLATATRELSRRIFRKLAEAEAEVHRTAISEVHFHEVGAVDALVDIVGAAACLTYLGAAVQCTPLPLGRGFVHCEHGVLPLPAPATVLCLRGLPTYDAGIEAELVTPTGAAIVSVVAEKFMRWPEFAPERVGYGAGTRRLPDRPNLLRVVLGTPTEAGRGETKRHAVVETNVDDMTGELAGHALQALLNAGALDAWITPTVMKKGRPGWLIAALACEATMDLISEVMLRETSSIGVRRTRVDRVERPRRLVEVETGFGPIPVKVSGGPFGPPQVKPEFGVCAERAAGAGVPVREVVAAALRAYAQSIA